MFNNFFRYITLNKYLPFSFCCRAKFDAIVNQRKTAIKYYFRFFQRVSWFINNFTCCNAHHARDVDEIITLRELSCATNVWKWFSHFDSNALPAPTVLTVQEDGNSM
jgi:hypothetical protein